MSRLATFLGLAIVAAAAYGADLAYDAGAFKVIEIKGLNGCEEVRAAGFIGPEDMVEAQDGRLIISTDDRPAKPEALTSSATAQGQALYIYDVHTKKLERQAVPPALEGDFRPHGMDLIAAESGGGDLLYAINHARSGDKLEVFRIQPGQAPVYERSIAVPYANANDLVVLGSQQIYVTFDHDSTSRGVQKLGDYARQARGFIGYYDGTRWRKVGEPLRFANGIAALEDKRHLVVSAMLDRSFSVYELEPSGDLSKVFTRRVDGGIDNITRAQDGSLWFAVHQNLLALNAMSSHREKRAPSQVIRVANPLDAQSPLEEILSDDGSKIAAASVALKSINSLYIGSVFDDRMLVCANQISSH